VSQALVRVGKQAPYSLRELVQPFGQLENVDSCVMISPTRIAVRKTGEKGFRLYTSTLKLLGENQVNQILSQQEQLIPFAFGTQWGLADTNGHVRIKPRFDEIIQIKDGKILVRQDSKFGVVSSNGKWIHKPDSDPEKAKVLLLSSKEEKAKSRFLDFEKFEFQDGDSIIRVCKKGKVGFLDLRSNQLIAFPSFEEASMFCYGKAVIKNENGYTLMDANGQLCPMQMFDFIQADRVPNLVFYSGTGADKWMGLLGTNCEILVPGSFKEIGHFYGDFAICSRSGEGYNYFDQKGDEVFPKQNFSKVENPANGFGILYDNSKWKIVNLNLADPRPILEFTDRSEFQLIYWAN
jgi:hypothetical protein